MATAIRREAGCRVAASIGVHAINARKSRNVRQLNISSANTGPPMQKHYAAGSVFGDQQAFPGRTMFGSACRFRDSCTFGNDCSFGELCVFGECCEFADGCKFECGCWFDRGCGFGVRCTFGVGCTAGEDCSYWSEFDAEEDTGDSTARWNLYVSTESHPANLTVREVLGR